MSGSALGAGLPVFHAVLDDVGEGAEVRLAEDEVAPVKALLVEGAADVTDLGPDLARRLLLAGLALRE